MSAGFTLVGLGAGLLFAAYAPSTAIWCMRSGVALGLVATLRFIVAGPAPR